MSVKNNFLFIHNYKVGGTSISKALSAYGISEAPQSIKITETIEKCPKIMQEPLRKFYKKLLGFSTFEGHCRAIDVKMILGDYYDKLFKFGFVRNPWDWQVSLYHYMKKNKKHHQHKLILSFESFDEYIGWRVNNDVQLQKQFYYDNENNNIVDFIGKIEELNKAINVIEKRLGFRIDVGHYNRSEHLHYTKYYNDKTKKMIEDAFAEDIDCFKYTYHWCPTVEKINLCNTIFLNKI